MKINKWTAGLAADSVDSPQSLFHVGQIAETLSSIGADARGAKPSII